MLLYNIVNSTKNYKGFAVKMVKFISKWFDKSIQSLLF